MTTGTSPDVATAARRRAAELLGVGENASPGEARRAYFRKVREHDFLPPPSLYRALRILERIGSKEARDLLERLSRGASESSLTSEAHAAAMRLSQGDVLAR